MALQITFTDDVISHATAANDDGSIRWHVYTRLIGVKPSIFVQRQVGGPLSQSGVLEAEVEFIQEGIVRSMSFNSTRQEFDLVFEINEQLYITTIEEADSPFTQAAQINVFSADYSFRPGDQDPPDVPGSQPGNARSMRDIAKAQLVQRHSPQVYNGPDPAGVDVIESADPTKLSVRWLPDFRIPQEQIIGFDIFTLEGAFGRFQKLNPTRIPYIAHIPVRFFEFDVPKKRGVYLVTQTDIAGQFAGSSALGRPVGLVNTREREGRLRSSKQILGNGSELKYATSTVRFFAPGGEGHQDNGFELVDKAPIFLGQIADTLSPHFPGGEGHRETSFVQVNKAPVFLGSNLSSIDLRPGGEGIRSAFTLTGFGTVVVT